MAKPLDEAISAVRGYLEQATEEATKATGLSTSDAIKTDVLLLAFYKATRHLSKLRSSFALQAEMLPELSTTKDRWAMGGMEECQKAQSALARAEKIAEEKYHKSMAQLSRTDLTGTNYQGPALKLMESYNQATAAARTALRALDAAVEPSVDGGRRRASATTAAAAAGRTVSDERCHYLPSNPAEPQQAGLGRKALPRTRAERVSAKWSAGMNGAGAGGGGGGGSGGGCGCVSHLGLAHRCNSEKTFRSSQMSQVLQQARSRAGSGSRPGYTSVSLSGYGLHHQQAGVPTNEMGSSSSLLSINDATASDGVNPVGFLSGSATPALLPAAPSFTRALNAAPPAATTLHPSSPPRLPPTTPSSASTRPISSPGIASRTTKSTPPASAASTEVSSAKPTLGLLSVAHGGEVWRRSMAVVAEERRAMSRAAAVTAAAAALPSSAAHATPADLLPEATEARMMQRCGEQEERRNRKLSPEEQRAAIHWRLEAQHSRASSSVCRQWLDAGSNARQDPASAATIVSAHGRAAGGRRFTRHTPPSAAYMDHHITNEDADSGAGVARWSGRQSSTGPTAGPVSETASEQQPVLDEAHAAAQAAHQEEVERATASDAKLAALLSATVSPPPFATVTTVPSRHCLYGETGLWARPEIAQEQRVDVIEVERQAWGLRGGDHDNGMQARDVGDLGALQDVNEDMATALRLAKQEEEEQAREDAQLALRLTEFEEAGREQRAERARRRAARRHARSVRRYAQSAGLDPAVAAAAFAAEGSAVPEAVRALQFQDIDENDFETLLELDAGGGASGGCCSGEKGLSEAVLEATLQPVEASGARLTESCAICMADYEEGDKLAVLPCLHAFHTECIRKWLLLRNLCPADMQPVVHDSSQEISATVGARVGQSA